LQPTRREFLVSLGGGALVAAAADHIPRFLVRAAAAATSTARERTGDRVLVVVQLEGGNDGLNTVVPYRMDDYYRRRPSIAVPRAAVRRLDDEIGLHPEMAGLHSLFEEGRLAVVQGVGYPDPDRSHFRSTEIWESADLAGGAARSGWLGRCLCHAETPRRSLLPGVALGARAIPQALSADPMRAAAVESLEAFRVRGEGLSAEQAALERQLLADLAALPRIDPEGSLEFVRASLATSLAAAERLHEAISRIRSAVAYPDFALARKLRQVAQVHLGGFDTHASQGPAHALLLRELSQSLKAFLDDLAAQGEIDRVLVMTFSEFGRRVEENGSLGTDHGTAAPLLMAGGRVKGGVFERHPPLDDLADGDFRFSIDFRRVYATAIERWLGLPSREVLGASFEPLAVV
jgi:uncharacterized protein (DUF1501 family)